jgi:hypothetical protein
VAATDQPQRQLRVQAVHAAHLLSSQTEISPSTLTHPQVETEAQTSKSLKRQAGRRGCLQRRGPGLPIRSLCLLIMGSVRDRRT